ncbi:hypothetical protein MAR_034702 [Mya arenaria]|uniref:Uncharacterized protein n=1 Tax=Mya arenaria TaxID=6604 RepID=A0ABY7ER17_MYAAR|nr:hypothetical protein MAR_034702 [Mya arenaria]
MQLSGQADIRKSPWYIVIMVNETTYVSVIIEMIVYISITFSVFNTRKADTIIAAITYLCQPVTGPDVCLWQQWGCCIECAEGTYTAIVRGGGCKIDVAGEDNNYVDEVPAIHDGVHPGKAYQVSEDSVTSLNHQGFTSEIDIDYFWNKIYIPFPNIVVNLEDRFPDLPLLQKFEVFNTRKFFGEEPTCCGEDDIKDSALTFGNCTRRVCGAGIVMMTEVGACHSQGAYESCQISDKNRDSNDYQLEKKVMYETLQEDKTSQDNINIRGKLHDF